MLSPPLPYTHVSLFSNYNTVGVKSCLFIIGDIHWRELLPKSYFLLYKEMCKKNAVCKEEANGQRGSKEWVDAMAEFFYWRKGMEVLLYSMKHEEL
jgi:hypothetical protein